MAENPIQRLLDQRQLPWRTGQRQLIERYGAAVDPWFNRQQVVMVDNEPPLLPGLLRPIHFEPGPNDNPSMPPLRLWAWAWARRERWWRSRAMASLQMVRESLEPTLGRPKPDHTSNTRGWLWRCGPASIKLMCFPPVLTLPPGGTVVPDRRDPRVDRSCWVELLTGYRPVCAPHEREWIDTFDPMIVLADRGGSRRIADNPSRQEVLEYVREPCPGFEKTIGRIGRTADGEALIFASDQLYIVPAAQVEHVHVERIAPARGTGSAALSLACRGDFGERPVRRVFLAGHGDPDGLNELAGRVAEWLGRPCVLGEYGWDD